MSPTRATPRPTRAGAVGGGSSASGGPAAFSRKPGSAGRRPRLPSPRPPPRGRGGGGRWRIVRQRWAGSLLEEAWLGGPTPALTVAAHAVAAADVAASAAAPEILHVTPTLTDGDLRVRVTGRVASAGDKVSLGDA